ncbi:MAG TPA: ferrochelatase [Jatrophihabitans sp.]|nr:ferrochelatase [Jatrophihabitans sp.]
MPASSAARYDAFLLLSFGGPQGPDEVLPFLRNVTAGRGVPDERLAEVAEHYRHFGGVSPITAQNQALLTALTAEFDRRGFALPTYVGNRNWHPFVTDTARQIAADGHREVLVLATSATGSYSGCRQYREDLARAASAAPGIRFTKLRHYFDHPGFIEANADAVRAALARLPAEDAEAARLVFTAHSIPAGMNATAGPSGGLYLDQHQATAALVAESVRGPGAEFDLVWQSRSGPAQVPWLAPDINDHLRALAAAGVRSVVVAPSGFVSDHLEVLWDLDNEAAATAAELGLRFVRAATAGTHPAFVAGLADLVAEQLTGAEPAGLSSLGICGWQCPDLCCPPPARRNG